MRGERLQVRAAVAAANPKTVVVINAGSPVAMPWLDEVAAVMQVWFPGEEMGNALADVIYGAVEPGGHLPTSWAASQSALVPVARALAAEAGATRPAPHRPRPRGGHRRS